MSQTQPEVRKLMSDIFGDSDSEDEAPLPPSSRPPATAPSSAPKVMAGVRRSVDDDNLFESDDDEDRPIAKKQRAASTKKESSKTTSSSSSSKGGKLGDESSDEYASEEEVERTAEDDKFIDGEDENAELLKEYEQDKQHFKDDRPEGSSKKGGKAHEPEGPAADVVTQVLRDIKGKRVEKLSEEQKQSLAQDLLYKMDKAAKEDEVSFLNRQPAVAKINMLETVRRILLIRELQHTLLEFDLLSVLKIWIEPKDSRELASLTVRRAVYDMLLRLPCQADHLKRSGIGKTVVALRKHRSEIPEHKAILKSIMEKWCRPIFSKSSDAHGDSYEDEVRNFELREAARQRRLERNEVDPGRRNLQEALTGSSAQSTDMYQRARTPYSTGFIFTVRPDEGSANAPAERPRQQQSLLKKAAETKSGGKVQLQKKMKELHTQGMRVKLKTR